MKRPLEYRWRNYRRGGSRVIWITNGVLWYFYSVKADGREKERGGRFTT